MPEQASWFSKTFSTGDIIAICAGAIGMLTAFYNLKGDAAVTARSVDANRAEIIQVEKRDLQRAEELKEYIRESEQRLRNELQATDRRNEQRYNELNSKIEQLLRRKE